MTEGPVRESERDSLESSTGLEPNIAGLLCYLLGFITGIVFLVIEKKDRFVRFHAYQSLATFGALFVLSVALRPFGGVGQLLNGVVTIGGIVLWILLMVQAFRGERYKLPAIGDWAEQQAGAAGAQ